MTTATTATPLSQANTAAFEAWGLEMHTQLAAVGLTNTGDTGQINWGTVTLPGANGVGGYEIWRFNDSLQTGPIGTVGTVVGGSGYTGTGTYTAVPLTGGTGSGAKATIVVASGAVSTVTITTAGTGYSSNDSLSAANSNLGGAGSGFSVPVATLTSAALPIYIKIEYGTGAGVADPKMWITIGQGSNGSGTLTGTTTTRVSATQEQTPSSTTNSFTSRWCYNTTYGFLGVVWKLAGSTGGVAGNSYGGFIIARTNSSSGTPTTDGVVLVTNSSSVTGTSGSVPGSMQVYSLLTNAIVPASVSASVQQSWAIWPMGTASTTYGGNQYVMPAVYADPVMNFSNVFGIYAYNDIALGSTFSATIVGSTALTYITVGSPFGTLGTAYQSTTALVATANGVGVYMLWQ